MERWKRLSCQKTGQNLLVNFIAIDKISYDIKVSDLNSVWQETLTAVETEERCKQLNPRLEVSLTNIVEHIQNTLDSEEINTLTFSHDSTTMIKLEMRNNFSGGIPFEWEFLCRKSPEQCHNVFLLPVARLITSLQLANNRLIDLIHKKDDEIKDYKEFSGATVSRPYLETEQFEAEIFGVKLRQSIEYQNAINNDTMSILTSKSVNDKLIELEKDISSPMTIQDYDKKDRNIQEKLLKGRTRQRRKNVRAPARGVEIESDQDDSSQEHSTKPKVTSKRTSPTSMSKTAKRKKTSGKRKNLF